MRTWGGDRHVHAPPLCRPRGGIRADVARAARQSTRPDRNRIGMAEPFRAARGALHAWRRYRHHWPHRRGAALGDVGSAGRGRQPVSYTHLDVYKRQLGVTTAERVAAAPDVPTIAEAGVPGYDTSSWFAFFVPAKTPAEIVAKMHADTVAVLAEPATKAKLDPMGVVIVGSTPEQLRAHLAAEMEKWEPVIKAANIRVNE